MSNRGATLQELSYYADVAARGTKLAETKAAALARELFPPTAKPLVWVDNHAGAYTVHQILERFYPRLRSNWDDIGPRCATKDEAKAACEAHHQARWLEQMA